MALIDDPHHGGDAYRYVDPEQLKEAAPKLLQACLQVYLTLISPVEEKDYKKLIAFCQEAMKAAGHPAGDHNPNSPPSWVKYLTGPQGQEASAP